MRILWWSNAPWCATGYGKQTALWAPLLQELGHEVAIGAFHGLHGGALAWNGIPVYPGGRDNWGLDVIAGHYQHWKANLAVTLMDTWVLDPALIEDDNLKVASWTPVDCAPLGAIDEAALAALGSTPIAISRHGEEQLKDRGFRPLYVPHGIDAKLFHPPADREGLRRSMGLAGRFVIGINAANTDHNRKGFPEQFQAFARFQRRHHDAVLLVHAVAENMQWGGLDLRALVRDLGIEKAVLFADQHNLLAGQVSDEAMANWYGALDVLSNCSWGEGFGIPIIEAQACGTPVIVSQASSMPELCGSGWQVDTEPFWVSLHQAWWGKPKVSAITAAYEKAYANASRKRQDARRFALKYDARKVLTERWKPALDALASM